MKNGGFWLLAVLGVILDRITKQWAVVRLMPRPEFPDPEIQLWPEVFHLTYVENRGAAWSLFEESGGFLRWISLIVSLVLMAYAIWGPRQGRWEQAGYGLILAGAVGNGIDRFVSGYVVDFFNFTLIQFPVFNVADIAINIGVGCLILGILRPTAPETAPETPALPDGSTSESSGDQN